MSFFVGGHTLRLTAERTFRCPFLENQLALRALFSPLGSFVKGDKEEIFVGEKFRTFLSQTFRI